MTWWDAAPVLLATLVVVLVPGGAVLASLGVRGLPLLALAPAVSTAVLGGTAVVVGFLRAPWQPWLVLPATVAGVGVSLLLRRLVRGPEALRASALPGAGAIVTVGLAVAALVGALPIAAGMRQVDRVPQTWDAVFHLNGIRYIEDTGLASTFLLNGMVNHESDAGLYPAGWHVSAAAVVEVLGADPAVVANVMALVLAGLVVPAGGALAARALMPDWRWAGAVGAVTAAVFAAMPALMLSWGTLWPNAWSTGMLPALLGSILLCLRRPDAVSWLAVALGSAGAALAHPSFVFAAVLLGAPLVLQALFRRWGALGASPVRRGIEVGALVLLGVAALLVMTQSSLLDFVRAFRWTPTETMGQALGESLVDAPLSELGHGVSDPSWILGALLLLGVFRAVSDRDQRAWVVSLALAIAGFVISAGAPGESILREYVTGYWYNDPVRLAALFPVVAAPLVAVGFRAAADWIAARSPGSPPVRTVLTVALVPVLLLVFLAATEGYAQKREDRLTFWYWPTPGLPDRQLVTPAEEELLRRLPDLLPEDAGVLADPMNGGALAYALGDRKVLFPHLTGTWSDTAQQVLRRMPDLEDPRTCEALRELGMDYLYVDTELYVGNNPVQEKFEGLDLAPTSGVEEIARADSATLYEITACR